MRAIERTVIIVLALLCIVLAWQNRHLKVIVSAMRAHPPVLERGEIVPQMTFTASDGGVDSLTNDTPGFSC